MTQKCIYSIIVLDTHYKGSWSTHSSGQTQGMHLKLFYTNRTYIKLNYLYINNKVIKLFTNFLVYNLLEFL